ncbi:MAG: hypothetical protein ABSE56_22725 [Bryobacteraceae bacterium]
MPGSPCSGLSFVFSIQERVPKPGVADYLRSPVAARDPIPPIAAGKSLGLYRQCSGEKMLRTAQLGGAGVLPMRRFVLNPLWEFNRNLMYQKELIGSLGAER